MKLDSRVLPRLAWLILPCLMYLTACSTGGNADNQRYFTWVDEYGRVRQSPITEEKSPVKQRVEQVKAEQPATGSLKQNGTSESTRRAAERSAPPAEGEPVQEKDVSQPTEQAGVAVVESAATKTRTHQSVESRAGSGPAVADRSAIKQVSEKQVSEPVVSSGSKIPATDANTAPTVSVEQTGTTQQAKAITDTSAKPASKSPANTAASSAKKTIGTAANDTSEYTLENYPDGNELAKQGFIREGDPLPYYTWRDAQGNVRVNYYRPEAGFEQPKSNRSAPPLTSALVIDGSRKPVAEQANPEAMAVLGLDRTETLLETWARQCCQELPKKDLAEWDESREFQLDLDDLAPEFEFSTGNSVYRLVHLPESESASAFVMQLRSYVTQGVFLPTLVFLDKDMETRRLVTDLAFEYHPENWHSHGYLEARVPVFPDHGDRWLLIMSRQEDQAGQTVFETEKGITVLRHTGYGLLGLAQLDG